jgi:hypothetical protein
VGGLERRLRALEEALDVRVCPECGFGPGTEPEEIEIEWIDDPEDDRGAVEPEFCGSCGQQLVWVITWGNNDEPDKEA